MQASKVYETRRHPKRPRSRKDNSKHHTFCVETAEAEQWKPVNQNGDTPHIEFSRITKSVNDLNNQTGNTTNCRQYNERITQQTKRSTPTSDIYHKSVDTNHRLDGSSCYCCCNHNVCMRRENGYQNVLHYLSQQPINHVG